MRFGWQKMALAVMAAGGAAGAWTAARLLRAEWAAVAGTEVGLRAAAQAVPGNAEYWVDLAGASKGDWERALAANPRSVEALLALGTQAEMEGRFEAAERYLLAAARADRGSDPRWALENFYFRRGRWDDFWRWAPEAGERAYGDPRPLFDLYWKSGAGAGEIFEKGIARAGRRAARSYLYYLAARGEIDGAEAPARLLMKGATDEDAGALRAYSEGLLRAGRGRAARAVWQELTRLGLAGGDPGFGWRVREVAGAPVLVDAAGGEIRVTFSGGQPESCEPVWRYVAMEPGGRYRLHFRYRTEGVKAGAGLQMTFGETAAVELGSDEWAEGRMEIEAGQAELGRAALKYRRARGHTRIEGTVWLRDFGWERMP